MAQPGRHRDAANDGTPRVWFSIVSETEAGLAIAHRALPYDHEGAQAAMRSAGLPESYRKALATGLWPSLDVLPDRERAETGRPITEASTLWPARQPARALPAV